MGVAKSDFSQVHRSRSDFIKHTEHLAQIDLDRPRFVRFWKRMQPLWDERVTDTGCLHERRTTSTWEQRERRVEDKWLWCTWALECCPFYSPTVSTHIHIDNNNYKNNYNYNNNYNNKYNYNNNYNHSYDYYYYYYYYIRTSKTRSGMMKQVYPTAEQALPRRCSGMMSDERRSIMARMTA